MSAEIRALVEAFVDTSNAEVGLCEDCGYPSDLGRKCRACYRAWSRLLWQDTKPEHARLLRVVATLREHPQRHGIAEHAETNRGELLSADASELLAEVRLCLAGPFGDSVRPTVRALASKAEAKR